MPILNSIANWLNTRRIYNIELFKKYPFEVQQETLYSLLEKASETTWGRKYNFKKLGAISEYQDALPILTYEDLEPYVERLRMGEKNLFWPGDIKWFAKSSGTTSSKSKFIPVTKDALEDCHFRGGKDVLAIYTRMFPESKILGGKGLNTRRQPQDK